MQCPTCGNDTPGTLGKCSHCEAPIDVYSVGPVASGGPPPHTPHTGPMVPLSAPPAAPPASPAAGTADVFGERTMMVPPPTPSWAPSEQPPVTPDLAMPPQAPPSPLSSQAPPSQASPSPLSSQAPPVPLSEPMRQSPSQTAPEPPAAAQPPLQLSVEPPAPPAQQPPAQHGSTPLPPVDPEDTAAWTFNPDEDDDPSGGFSAPAPPMWSGAQPALPAAGPADPAPSAFGLEPLPERTESIVPDSWFAQPRKPDAADADATQVVGGQQPATPPTMMDADATQYAPGPGPMNPGMPGAQPTPMGFGANPDQTRMDPGLPMGPPPMGTPPMGQVGMGQGGMPMGPMAQPGPAGPGDPAYGGYQPGHGDGRPGGGGPSKPLIAAVAALVTIAVGSIVFVAWPSGDDPSANTGPDPSPSNKQVAEKNPIPAATKEQAAAMNAVLNDSVGTRRVLAGALGRAGKCKTLPQAIQGFQTVAQQRQNQLNRTRDLQVDKLAKGEQLRSSLTQALTASLQVDQVLLRWAQQNQSGCRGKPRPSAAQVPGRAAIERRATSAKKRFVVLWNPVAQKTGQPQRSWRRV
ncbi:hypothetical protein [Actinomadura sp. 9N215]|uniref:hypothetical protein n=1 Tax=Actinomadura sp. 9N215 TaxID=3375150 RepID=UPI00379ED0F9